MWTSVFWRSAAERAIKTFAQALVVVLGADGIGLVNAPWVAAVSTAGMAALLSVLTSIASAGSVGDPGMPSLVNTDRS